MTDPAWTPRLGANPDPWPASSAFGSSGLTLGGIAAADLAARFGTPLIVVDEDDLRARCRSARAAFPRILYAVKAFTAHAVIRIALSEGLDLLASTGGEVEACLRAGAPGSRIALHGNNKSDEELTLAVRAGLSLVIADGAEELERLDAVARRAGRVQPFLLRVVPGIEVDTHAAIATGHGASKFGTPLAAAVGIVRAALASPGLRFEGLHAHIGSQVQDAAPYLRELDALVTLATRLREETGATVGTLDIGGGFAVTYRDEHDLDPAEVAFTLLSRLRDRCAAEDLPIPTLVAEPGRALVAQSAVTLYAVGGVKEAGGRRLVAVDGGMSDNVRPALYDARYTVAAAGPRCEPMSSAAGVTVVGKHCESGDVLADEVSLPAELLRGDLLAFAGTGAYTYSLASTYNRIGRPAVVSVRGGDVTPWLRREDAADMDRFETAGHRVAPRETILPESITIRPARAADAGSFMTFWAAIVDEARHVRSERVAHPTRVYRRRFRRPWTDDEAQVMALMDERVVGHLYIQRERHPVTHHVATLGIAVASDHRGEGIGTALMSEAFGWARDAGVEKIVLSVYPHNADAISLYRKFGFVEEGRLARQSRKSYGYEDEILMGAWLGPIVERTSDRP